MKILKSISIFFIFLILFLIFGEFFLRITEIDPVSVTQNDPVLGSKLRPNRDLILFKEGFYLGGTNEYGYYGPSYPQDKDSSIFRIALVGDSYVEALHLFDRDHFRNIMEQELSAKIEKKVEVLNFGKAGSDLNDQYCYYKNFIKKFNPDIILFFIFKNDFLIKTDRKKKKPICYIENDSIKIDYSFRHSSEYKFLDKIEWIRSNSVIFRNLYFADKKIKRGLTSKILFGKFYEYFMEPSHKKGKKRTRNFDNVKITELSEGLLKEINKSDKNIFIISEHLNDSITDYLMKLHTKTIDLSPVLDELRENGKRPKYWKSTRQYGHWNQIAHKAIGNFLADKLLLFFNGN